MEWARDPEAGVDGDIPDGKVKLPKLGLPVKDILSRDEIERLEDVATAEREKLIIRVLGDTGVRVGELVKLRADDLITRDRKNFLHIFGGRETSIGSALSSTRRCGAGSSGSLGAGQQMPPSTSCSSVSSAGLDRTS